MYACMTYVSIYHICMYYVCIYLALKKQNKTKQKFPDKTRVLINAPFSPSSPPPYIPYYLRLSLVLLNSSSSSRAAIMMVIKCSNNANPVHPIITHTHTLSLSIVCCGGGRVP